MRRLFTPSCVCLDESVLHSNNNNNLFEYKKLAEP